MRRSIPSRGLVALVALAACGHHKGSPSAPGGGDGGLPPLIKSVAVAFESQPAGASSRVFLPISDETGKVTSYPVGDFPGTCAKIAADGADLVTMECNSDSRTTRLHAIKQGQDIVVLRENVAPGGAPDPMNRDEIQRYTMPVDTKIEAAK